MKTVEACVAVMQVVLEDIEGAKTIEEGLHDVIRVDPGSASCHMPTYWFDGRGYVSMGEAREAALSSLDAETVALWFRALDDGAMNAQQTVFIGTRSSVEARFGVPEAVAEAGLSWPLARLLPITKQRGFAQGSVLVADLDNGLVAAVGPRLSE